MQAPLSRGHRTQLAANVHSWFQSQASRFPGDSGCSLFGCAPPPPPLTRLSYCVQSSWSLLEQYMGRWPMVMIQGRSLRLSGRVASCHRAKGSQCLGEAPLPLPKHRDPLLTRRSLSSHRNCSATSCCPYVR